MTAEHSLTLAAGPLAVAVSCPGAALAAALRRRYAPFLAPAAPRVALAITLGSPGPRPESLVVDGPRAAMVGPGVAAGVDLAAAAATLVAEPARAEEAAEQLLRVVFALLAIDAGGLLVHGAAIAAGPRAYLFLGPSGAGKTTVARNAAGRRVLNDDLALLWPAPGGWDVIATPFSNPSQVAPAGPGSARLAAIFHLVQAPAVARAPIGAAAAVAALAARAPIVGGDGRRGAALLRRARAICAIVESSHLHFRPDPSFWAFVEPDP